MQSTYGTCTSTEKYGSGERDCMRAMKLIAMTKAEASGHCWLLEATKGRRACN